MKDQYKIELQKPRTMKLFCSTIDKTKNEVASLEVAEVVLVQYNLAENQYQ